MRRLVLLCSTIAVAAIPAAASAQSYTLVDLAVGSPYDGGMTVNSINALGHMSGYGVIASTGEIHAYLYKDGSFQDLGLLGYQASDGISINNSDQLAVDGIGPGSTALFYSGGQAQPVGNVDGGYTSAYAINNHGDIVGSGQNGDGALIAFSWIGGVFTDLSTVNMLRAVSINDGDQIVGSIGYYWVYGGYIHSVVHGCLYSGGVLTDLGCITGDPRTNTEALGISGIGQIVGYSTAADGLRHAFLYSAGTMQDLGTLDGDNATAIAINSGGVVIGNLTNPSGASLGAFVYSGGTMKNLSNLIGNLGTGWSQLTVTGINDGGSIVGYGAVDGTTHGFVLTPNQSTAVRPTPVNFTAIAASRPNPFRSATEISFSLSQRAATGNARLEIFDASGRRVAVLLDQSLAAGEHTMLWDGRAEGGGTVATGVYFARLSTVDGTASRRLVLAR